MTAKNISAVNTVKCLGADSGYIYICLRFQGKKKVQTLVNDTEKTLTKRTEAKPKVAKLSLFLDLYFFLSWTPVE